MEGQIEELLEQQRANLKSVLQQLRQKQFSYAVSQLIYSLPTQNRCIICTLELPCKHFKAAEEMPSVSLPDKQEFSLHEYTQGLDISALNFSINQQPPKQFNVRYRGKQTAYKSVSPRQTVPTTKKLKVLEQIEVYREQKLQNQILKIQELKKQEEQEKINKKIEEQRRIRHMKKQKEKLVKYKEEVRRRKASMEIVKEKEAKQQKVREMRRKQYYQDQKKKLDEHYQEKREEVKKKKQSPQLERTRVDLRAIYS